MTMLVFDTQDVSSLPPAAVALDGLNSEHLMQELIAAGHPVFLLAWDDLDPVVLATEDDAMFLCEAYAELQHFLKHEGAHHVFLGDGELNVQATREGDRVRLVRTHSPHLNRGLSTTKEYTVSLTSYADAWTRLMSGLLGLRNESQGSPG
jgi:hypothetical protein